MTVQRVLPRSLLPVSFCRKLEAPPDRSKDGNGAFFHCHASCCRWIFPECCGISLDIKDTSFQSKQTRQTQFFAAARVSECGEASPST